MRNVKRRLAMPIAAVMAACLVAPPALAASPAKLGSYNADPRQSSISGISSGADMAIQFGVAYSSLIKGVGALAGSPYSCALGDHDQTKEMRSLYVFNHCMISGDPARLPEQVAYLQALTEGLGAKIDPIANLRNQKIWLFHGYNDGLVRHEVAEATADYYRKYVSPGNLYYQGNINAGHGQVVINTPNGIACDQTAAPFNNNCNYDAAGKLLQHIYGALNPRSQAISANLTRFNQSPFGGSDIGLAKTGSIYVPAACRQNQPCRIHIALHGCLQDVQADADFPRQAGYNEWAEANNLIILYPQIDRTGMLGANPKGCWDWWGYDDAPFTSPTFATHDGAQITALKRMLDTVAGKYGAPATQNPPVTAPIVTTADATDSAISLVWVPLAGTTYDIERADAAAGPWQKVGGVPDGSFADAGLTANTAYYYRVTALRGNDRQISAVIPVSTAAKPPACSPWFRPNPLHAMESRAGMSPMTLSYYAYGSGAYMGSTLSVTTETLLHQTGPFHFELGPCD